MKCSNSFIRQAVHVQPKLKLQPFASLTFLLRKFERRGHFISIKHWLICYHSTIATNNYSCYLIHLKVTLQGIKPSFGLKNLNPEWKRPHFGVAETTTGLPTFGLCGVISSLLFFMACVTSASVFRERNAPMDHLGADETDERNTFFRRARCVSEGKTV